MPRALGRMLLVAATATFWIGTPAVAHAAPVDAPKVGEATGLKVEELSLSGVRSAALGDLPAAPPAVDALAADPNQAPQPTATASPHPDVLTTELATSPFTVFGVTWDAGPNDVVIRYRVRESGQWSDWTAVGPSDAAPDANRAEAADGTTRGGTDPIVASNANGVQLWAESASATVTGLKVVLIDPGTLATDAAPQALEVTNTAATVASAATTEQTRAY